MLVALYVDVRTDSISQTNFFEKRVSDYKIAAVRNGAASDATTNKVL